MSDYFATFLWIVAYSLPSFFIQLVFCFRVKNRSVRYIPVYLSLLGVILTVDTYFNFSGLHSGWNELAAFIVGMYTAIYLLGTVMAILTYKTISKIKAKKR